MDPGGYLRAYDEKDIQLICCQADGSTLWLVPPVVQAGYMNSLRWSMDIIFSWQLTRDRPKGKEVVRYELIVRDEDLPTYSEIMAVLNGSANSFRIHNVFPRYFRVTGSGEVRFLEDLVDLVSGDLFSIVEIWSGGLFMLMAICEDIYAARAEGELEVEEVLYWTLVKIYRSPHMLLEYTKPD
ncbi:hypothetical protein GH714_025142 [Hevea brasiliensis]|uniref:Piezo non-specific cation channel cap domain-containing protein n=1 Tax=Hevea brasiliensis TaxID=3981 RepID=A0A6A6M466_HEVBR|nr:hypothetical protein GH714_025142 [Hevea brasiliensis]